jgi:hypothetical protein
MEVDRGAADEVKNSGGGAFLRAVEGADGGPLDSLSPPPHGQMQI